LTLILPYRDRKKEKKEKEISFKISLLKSAINIAERDVSPYILAAFLYICCAIVAVIIMLCAFDTVDIS